MVTLNTHGVVENVNTLSGNRVIRKFACKDFKLPTNCSNPPYYVEYPPEEDNPPEISANSIPHKVEDALSDKLATGLNLQRGRDHSALCITSGDEVGRQTAGTFKMS